VLWRRGVRVPQDLSIATFNNAYPVEHTIPPLTAVALPTREMGRRAAEMLLDRIEHPEREPAGDVMLEEQLIVRESTAAPRADA
jgi:DNA-binding LacI/PurR family transcriptional regulator